PNLYGHADRRGHAGRSDPGQRGPLFRDRQHGYLLGLRPLSMDGWSEGFFGVRWLDTALDLWLSGWFGDAARHPHSQPAKAVSGHRTANRAGVFTSHRPHAEVARARGKESWIVVG